jgi:hypothetical protein
VILLKSFIVLFGSLSFLSLLGVEDVRGRIAEFFYHPNIAIGANLSEDELPLWNESVEKSKQD